MAAPNTSWIPEKLPIARMEEEDDHTYYLGKVGDGRLFWGYTTYAFTKPYSETKGEDWRMFRKEFAVLHLFDNDGNYLESKHWSALTSENKDIEAEVENMVDKFGEITYCDIEIKPFETEIEGIVFGLIPDMETESIELQPSSAISFQEPWDGEYYS